MTALREALILAEQDYEAWVRANYEVADAVTVGCDLGVLRLFGDRLGKLAALMSHTEALCEYANKRPAASRLAVLMAESIDGEFDGAAWSVICAAALLAAEEG